MRLLKLAATAAALFLLAVPMLQPTVAFALEATQAVVPAEASVLQQLLVAIVPAIGVLISAVVLYGANLLKKNTGINIEAKHRDALQSALMNAVLYAIQRTNWVPEAPTDNLLASARGYVESSVPDALKQFGIDVGTEMGMAQLDRLLTPKLPIPAGTVMPNGDKLVGRAS